MARAFYSEMVVITDDEGNAKALSDIEVSVKKRGGGNAQIYTDQVAEEIKDNPFITGSNGAVEFWAENGGYEVSYEDTLPDSRINARTVPWNAVSFEDVFDLLPTGTIVPTALRYAPNGWLFCDGTTISRNVFSRLWDAFRTDHTGKLTNSSPHGNGDDAMTFELPDLRESLPLPDINYMVKT